MAEYGARTGVTTLIKVVRALCRLYLTYSAKINAWVNTAIPSGDRATVLAWLAGIAAVCAILEAATDD